jgi:hypothetical protein
MANVIDARDKTPPGHKRGCEKSNSDKQDGRKRGPEYVV